MQIQYPWTANEAANCEAIEAIVSPLDEDEFQVVRVNVRDYASLPVMSYDDYKISGHGVPSSSICGMPIDSFRTKELDPETGCESREWRYHNCKKQGCPECYRVWASRAARRAATYISGAINRFGGQWFHCVLSSEPGVFKSLAEWFKFVDFALHFLHSPDKGKLGYSVVCHPYRLRCVNWDASHVEAYDNWDLDVNPKKPCGVCGEHSYSWLPGMHFHIITNCWVDLNDMWKLEKLKQLGFRYANLSQDAKKRFLYKARKFGWNQIPGSRVWYDLNGQKTIEPVGYLESYLDVYKVLRYELSHSLWREGKQAIKYSGILRKGTFKVLETKSHWEPVKSTRDTEFYKEKARCGGKQIMFIKRSSSDIETTALERNLRGGLITLMHKVIDEVTIDELGTYVGEKKINYLSTSYFVPRFVRFPKEKNQDGCDSETPINPVLISLDKRERELKEYYAMLTQKEFEPVSEYKKIGQVPDPVWTMMDQNELDYEYARYLELSADNFTTLFK